MTTNDESFRLQRGGVGIAIESHGLESAPTVVFAHGFGQTRQSWQGSVRALAAAGYRTLSFDARGHGDSDRAPGHYRMEDFGADLAAVTALASRPPVLVGASMGGLLGLALAGEQTPPPFRALILVDITPRWEARGVERILAFMRAKPDGFADYDEVADAIAAYLPQRRERRTPAQMQSLLRRGADGRLHWHWDPAMLASIKGDGEAAQPRLLAAARHVRVPVLLLSGGRSDVVSDATVAEFLKLVPQARHVELTTATHMVAGDANDAFTREILAFLAQLDLQVQPS